MSVIEARWMIAKLRPYVETISNYDARLFQVEVSKCWLELTLPGAENADGLVIVDIPAGHRGESWMIIATSLEKMLEFRAWVISRVYQA